MSRPIRVVHIAWMTVVGGGELFLLDLLKALEKLGVDQELYCVGPGGDLLREVERRGIRTRRFEKGGKLGLAAIGRLAAALRRAAPDVVQTHGEAGIFWGIPASRLAGCRAICALVYQVSRDAPDKMWAMRMLLPRADRVVAGSAAVRDFLSAATRIDAAALQVIHCGIDTRRFRAAAVAGRSTTSAPEAQVHGAARDATGAIADPVLITVGRLVEQKGHDVLLEAFHRLRATRPTARLLIVGDGVLRRHLERRVAELEIEPQVRFLGTIYPTIEVLEAADLFVFPSLSEPQGLAVLEAFAAGVPVVASRTGGIVEMLESGKHGVLVEPGDPGALATAIDELLEQPATMRAYVRNGRERLAEFDIGRVAAHYHDLYTELAGRRTSSTGPAAGGKPKRL